MTQTPTRAATVPLAAFVDRLRAACDPVRAEVLQEVLDGFTPDRADLAPLVRFAPDRYVRERLYRDASFELLLLCWNRGQATPVHDHDGQAGWFSVLDGVLSVQEYERTGGPSDLRTLAADVETEPGSIRLRPGQGYSVAAGDSVAEADAPETIHRVGPRRGRAVSLHLYAGPLDRLLVFDERRGTARRVAL